MPTVQDESTRRIELGSGQGLVSGAALGIIFDPFLGRSGLGLVFGAAFGLVLGAGLSLVLRPEVKAGTPEVPPTQIQS